MVGIRLHWHEKPSAANAAGVCNDLNLKSEKQCRLIESFRTKTNRSFERW
jgi:hypothetical protein